MRRQVNMHEAKTHLSRLIEQADAGDEVIIAKAGKPVARLVGYEMPVNQRKPGIWRGKVELSDDFDTLPASMAAAFRGEAD